MAIMTNVAMIHERNVSTEAEGEAREVRVNPKKWTSGRSDPPKVGPRLAFLPPLVGWVR